MKIDTGQHSFVKIKSGSLKVSDWLSAVWEGLKGDLRYGHQFMLKTAPELTC